MSAGLPGLGLGGLFFIFSALLAPFGELWRAIRGRSRPGAWRVVGRQFTQAVAMVVAIDLTLRLTYVGLALAGAGDVPSAASGTVLPLTLIGITTALLALVVSGAKLAQLGFRLRNEGLPRLPDALPRPAPLRALGFGGAAAIAWVALLSVGASELSPLAPAREAAPASAGEPDRARVAFSDPVVRPGTEDSSTRASLLVPDAGTASDPGGGGEGSGADDGAQPSPSAPSSPSASAPSPSGQAHAVSPGGGVPQGVPVGSGSPNPPAADSSPPSPPANAGSPAGSPAPEHAGPPEGSPAPEHAGPPEGSPASERSSTGAPQAGH